MRALLILITFLFSYTAFSQDTVLTEYVSRNPYYKNVIIESGYRTTYYLSEFDRGKKLPLIIYIQGSGYNSLFSKQGESIVPTSGHINLPYLSQGKAKVLIIEKPGVEFLDNRSSNDRNEEFDKQFSLENWSRRIEKVISRVLLSEKIDSTKIMVVGHSEGGIVAARVANLMKGRISNVCIMAGEGPSQLYSLYSLANSGEFFNENGKNEGERINYVLEKWNEIKEIRQAPQSSFWGFPI